MITQTITVNKLNHRRQPVITYEGTVLERTETLVVLEARFQLNVKAAFHHFKPGDRLIEWFFTDRWYNIFELHHHETDELEGWYCNITHPARVTEDTVEADDLGLDLMVYPDGKMVVLDEEEFNAMELDEQTRRSALAGLADLQQLAKLRLAPFDKIQD
jgi:uncharacterized protein